MAQTYQTEEGTLVIPGAYARTMVQSQAAGLATTGVVMIVGEADFGPDFTIDNVTENYFTPEQDALVRAKYGSGRLVEAFLAAARPMADAAIPGGPTRIYLAKTNRATKASATLTGYKASNGEDIVLSDRLGGDRILRAKVDEVFAERTIATGPLFFTPKAGTVTVRVNGKTAVSIPVEGTDTAETAFADVSSPDFTVTVADGKVTFNTTGTGTTQAASLEVCDPAGILAGEGVNEVLYAPAERRVKMTVTAGKQKEEIVAGGEVAMRIGFSGEGEGSFTIGDNKLVLKVDGGAQETIPFATFRTVKDVVEQINTLAGWSAKAGTVAFGARPAAALDEGTYTCSTDLAGGLPCGVRMDAALFYLAVYEAKLVELSAEAAAGLPANGDYLLSGGRKGGTKAEDIVAALAALKRVQGNFVVLAFDRDATEDKLELATENESDYTIQAAALALREHLISCRTTKARKHRQGFIGHRSTFAKSKQFAGDLGYGPLAVAFEDVSRLGSDGLVSRFGPWIVAAIAAGAQAAGGHKTIFSKKVNVSGVFHKDFAPEDADMVEDALLNGLLPIVPADDGGFEFVSDQTTYTEDDNFVFNSIQAVYAMDTIAATIQRKMQKAFLGESLADVSANVALAYLQSIMAELYRLKRVASSSDAPLGYKNALIVIEGKTMKVSLEVKLAGAIYFIPIEISISEVSQRAGA